MRDYVFAAVLLTMGAVSGYHAHDGVAPEVRSVRTQLAAFIAPEPSLAEKVMKNYAESLTQAEEDAEPWKPEVRTISFEQNDQSCSIDVRDDSTEGENLRCSSRDEVNQNATAETRDLPRQLPRASMADPLER